VDRFEYVMVLISIIVGLGIAHVLLGIGGIIDRRSGRGPHLELSLAHGVWLVYIFVWMVQFWWWEFRFSELGVDWSIGLYFFLVAYSVTLFLAAVILVPRSWDGVESLGDYFVERRAWFYSILLVATGLDVIDTLLKGGWEYMLDLGPWTVALPVLTLLVCVVGFRSRQLRHHSLLGIGLLTVQLIQGFVDISSLGL